MTSATRKSGSPSPRENVACPKIDKFATRLIRRKAREVVRRAGFSPSDREDVEQELTLVLLRRLGKFNPRVAHYNAFVTTVIERYVATILEHRAANMRTYQRDGGSLNVLVDDGNGRQIELSATIPSTQHSLRTGCHPRTAVEQSDLRHDVHDVIATLTPRQRAICDPCRHGCLRISGTPRQRHAAAVGTLLSFR